MTEIKTNDLNQSKSDEDDDESIEDDDESLWETEVCWSCDGDGCSRCNFDGWYYPAWTEPNGIN